MIQDIENEQWRAIEGYEGLYQISNMGRVKSLPKMGGWHYIDEEKLLNMHDNGKGYLYVDLYDYDGNRKKSYVHRLVAFAFVNNPNNHPIINHKDEDRKNNISTNLEWCTQKYNLNYGNCRQRMREAQKNRPYVLPSHAKSVICTTTNMIFPTVKDAAEYYNIPNLRSHISRWCNGSKNFNYLGKLPDGTKLKWKYYADYLKEQGD